MAPAAIAAIAAIPSLVKGAQGIGQLIKAKKLGQTPRPKYVRPGEVDQLLSNARNLAAGTKMAGQSEMNEQMESDIANMLREAQKTGSPDDFMTAVTGLASQKSKRVQELTVAAAKDYQTRQDRLSRALGIGAEASDKEFDMNLYQPYLASQAASSALREAGATNILGAIDEGARIAIGEARSREAGGTDLDLANIPYR